MTATGQAARAVWSPRPPPAASYSPKDRGTRSRRGTAGAYAFPHRSPSGPSSRSSLPVTARPNPVGLLVPEAAATLLDQRRPARSQRQTTARRELKVEPAEQAGLRRGGRRPWIEPRRPTGRAFSDAAQPPRAAAQRALAWWSATAQTHLVQARSCSGGPHVVPGGSAARPAPDPLSRQAPQPPHRCLLHGTGLAPGRRALERPSRLHPPAAGRGGPPRQ